MARAPMMFGVFSDFETRHAKKLAAEWLRDEVLPANLRRSRLSEHHFERFLKAFRMGAHAAAERHRSLTGMPVRLSSKDQRARAQVLFDRFKKDGRPELQASGIPMMRSFDVCNEKDWHQGLSFVFQEGYHWALRQMGQR